MAFGIATILSDLLNFKIVDPDPGFRYAAPFIRYSDLGNSLFLSIH